jgi:hypothetical protein
MRTLRLNTLPSVIPRFAIVSVIMGVMASLWGCATRQPLTYDNLQPDIEAYSQCANKHALSLLSTSDAAEQIARVAVRHCGAERLILLDKIKAENAGKIHAGVHAGLFVDGIEEGLKTQIARKVMRMRTKNQP